MMLKKSGKQYKVKGKQGNYLLLYDVNGNIKPWVIVKDVKRDKEGSISWSNEERYKEESEATKILMMK
jgi:hypothetical protein